MGALLEQLASRKLGVAVVAMFLIAQMGADADRTAACLIGAIAALHIVCQTWLDVKNGHDAEDQPTRAVTKDGLLAKPVE